MKIVSRVNWEPVGIEEAKVQARVDPSVNDAEDALFRTYISAAREWAEAYTGRFFVGATVEDALSCFPCGAIDLDGVPATEVVSIKYYAEDDATTEVTLPSGEYFLETDVTPQQIRRYSGAWPKTTTTRAAAVKIRYKVGPTSTEVDSRLKQAILLRVTEFYDDRHGEATNKHKRTAEILLDQIKIYNA